MGLKDLNIEFEDENEKDKSNAIDPEVELNFGANANEAKAGQTSAKVVNIKQQPLSSSSQGVAGGGVSGVSKETIETILQNLTSSIIDSEKEKRKYLVEIISESKLFEHKINGILNKLVKTAPDSKNDLIMIKKLVTDLLKTIQNN